MLCTVSSPTHVLRYLIAQSCFHSITQKQQYTVNSNFSTSLLYDLCRYVEVQCGTRVVKWVAHDPSVVKEEGKEKSTDVTKEEEEA